MLASALTVVALVAADQTALRAAPRDSAPQQAVLWQGDSLEIRGEKGDFLQVYDHRRERAGYIRASQVRVHSLKPEAAPELLAVVRFLKETPGSEALGIAYAAAYLRAAPAEAIGPEVFDALGQMADRLARRASSGQAGRAGEINAAHLEVAAAYGVTMTAFERDGQIRLCAEGDAQRRVLALPASAVQKALAALALTRHECVSPALTPMERYALDNWRADVLERVELVALPEVLKNRIRLRQAGVWASLAYQRARRPDAGAAAVQEAATRAIDALAAINKAELMETDAAAYSDAAIRVGASRWAAATGTPTGSGKMKVVASAGEPGQTCIALVDARQERKAPLVTRCTYGIVWTASAAANADGSALALAVQGGDTWRELWVFRKDGEAWSVDVLPPGTDTPTLGYVEFAGWVPGGREMLAAREVKAEGRYRRSFEVLGLGHLETRRQADRPENLSTFYRWQSALWKAGTVALR